MGEGLFCEGCGIRGDPHQPRFGVRVSEYFTTKNLLTQCMAGSGKGNRTNVSTDHMAILENVRAKVMVMVVITSI